MERDTWQAQRTSFGGVAEVYERSRPGYPRAAVDWLLGTAPRRVLDLGAGTGKLSRELVGAGHEVVAVEPSEGMRAAMRAALPGVRLLAGSAEDVPLPDADVDAVVAGQAYHWFDPSRAHAEMARVLRPDGVVGLLWNLRDEAVAWVAALTDVLGDEAGDTSRRVGEDLVPSLGPAFTAVERTELRQVVALSLDRLVELVSCRSYVITLPRTERDALLERVRELVRTHPQTAGRATVDLPYVTVCYRARRR